VTRAIIKKIMARGLSSTIQSHLLYLSGLLTKGELISVKSKKKRGTLFVN
jgi:hypothetical protein